MRPKQHFKIVAKFSPSDYAFVQGAIKMSGMREKQFTARASVIYAQGIYMELDRRKKEKEQNAIRKVQSESTAAEVPAGEDNNSTVSSDPQELSTDSSQSSQ